MSDDAKLFAFPDIGYVEITSAKPYKKPTIVEMLALLELAKAEIIREMEATK